MQNTKYQRKIETTNGNPAGMSDVYNVLEAFGVTCPARAHAIKKLLCAGQRGKGGVLDDLFEAAQAVDRAGQLETQRQRGCNENTCQTTTTQNQDEPAAGAQNGGSVFQGLRDAMWTVAPVKEDDGTCGYAILAPGGGEFIRYTEAPNGPDLRACGNAARHTSVLLNKRLQDGSMQMGEPTVVAQALDERVIETLQEFFNKLSAATA